MFTKELPIEQARAGEEYGNKVVFNSDEFKTQLHRYGVNDLFDSKLKIKQDNQKYIFAINGENKFAVNSRIDFTTFINDFYRHVAQEEQRAEAKKAVIEVSEFEKKTKVEITITETERDLQILEDQILKNDTLEERATDIENVKFKVERLMMFFVQEKDLAQEESTGRIFNQKYDRKDKGLRKIQKTEINRRLKELSKIKEQIERIERNKDKKYEIQRENGEIKEVKMDDINGLNTKITLKQLSDRIESLGKEAPDFIMTRNDIILERGDTTTYYELIMNNKKDVRKLNSALNRINKEYIQLNKLGLTEAKRQALQQDLKRLQEYLESYINDPNKPLEPFIPQSGDAFEKLCDIDPELKSFAKLNKRAKKPTKGEPNPEYPGSSENTETENTGGQEKQKNVYQESSYNTSGEAFEKGGIGGVMKHRIDQTNMEPHQKQFRGGVGNLALTGGMIFVGWKMIKSARNLLTGKNKGEGKEKQRREDRGRLLGPTALIFGAQARSGEGPMGLFKGGKLTEKMANIFGKKTNTENLSEQDQETQLTYTEGFPGVTALFNGLTYGDMKHYTIKDNRGRIKINPDEYENLLRMFKSGSKKNEIAANFLEKIGKNDDKNMIDLALTGMGVSRENIQDESKKNINFNETASAAIVRLRSVEAYMDDKGYNAINPETMPLVKKYIREGTSINDLKELDKRGDVFYKEIIVTDKTGLETKIKDITQGNLQKEQELLLAINTFYDYMPNADKNIDLIGTRPMIKFKTYEQETSINLEKKSIDGFTPSRFSSYFELFKAANLTNRIKDICKDKTTNSPDPFHLSIPGRDIEFSDPETFKLDTEIVSAGRGGSLKNISPTLEQYKQEYCDYLNSLKFRKTSTTDVATNMVTSAV